MDTIIDAFTSALSAAIFISTFVLTIGGWLALIYWALRKWGIIRD